MPPFILLFLALALLVSALFLMAYGQASNRAWEKNQTSTMITWSTQLRLQGSLRLDILIEGDELNDHA